MTSSSNRFPDIPEGFLLVVVKHSAVENVARSRNPHEHWRFDDAKKTRRNRFAALDNLKLLEVQMPVNAGLETCSQKLRTAVRVVPIVFRAPLMRFNVPPLVILPPAILTRLRQFVARMLGLLAVIAVMLDRLVQVVVGLFGSVLTRGLARFHTRRTREQQKSTQHRQGDEQLSVLQDSSSALYFHCQPPATFIR
jgi:hypothetical protein